MGIYTYKRGMRVFELFYEDKQGLWPKEKRKVENKNEAWANYLVMVNPNERKRILNFIKAYKNYLFEPGPWSGEIKYMKKFKDFIMQWESKIPEGKGWYRKKLMEKYYGSTQEKIAENQRN